MAERQGFSAMGFLWESGVQEKGCGIENAVQVL